MPPQPASRLQQGFITAEPFPAPTPPAANVSAPQQQVERSTPAAKVPVPRQKKPPHERFHSAFGEKETEAVDLHALHL